LASEPAKSKKAKPSRHALTNYGTLRRRLKELIDLCDVKMKKGGRVNPSPLREKLVEIRKLIKTGSYD
jgi:hypothetical protein